MHYSHKDVPKQFADPKPIPKPPKEKRGLKRNLNPTGERSIFKVISDIRPHVSFISGQYLGVDMPVSSFAHCLSKAKNKFPLFKLNPKNIILLTFEEHREWDFGLRSTLKTLPEWDKMFKLEAELLAEYRQLKQK